MTIYENKILSPTFLIVKISKIVTGKEAFDCIIMYNMLRYQASEKLAMDCTMNANRKAPRSLELPFSA